jgi:hypothetical protein
MNNLDWTKAPKGATHRDTLLNRWCNAKGWWSLNGIYEECLNNEWGRDTRYIARPESKSQWDGLGMPPVGTVCEYRNGSGTEWHLCTIKYVLAGDVCGYPDAWRAVIWSSYLKADHVAHSTSFEFRPTKTNEERYRQLCIAEALQALSEDNFDAREVLGELYDAGTTEGQRESIFV